MTELRYQLIIANYI